MLVCFQGGIDFACLFSGGLKKCCKKIRGAFFRSPEKSNPPANLPPLTKNVTWDTGCPVRSEKCFDHLLLTPENIHLVLSAECMTHIKGCPMHFEMDTVADAIYAISADRILYICSPHTTPPYFAKLRPVKFISTHSRLNQPNFKLGFERWQL